NMRRVAMFPHTAHEIHDDSAFLAAVDRVIAESIERYHPEDVYLIRIDNWFDHKWLGFKWGFTWDRNRLDVPTFTPNRIVSQQQFGRLFDGDYQEREMSRLVHLRECQHLGSNKRRPIIRFSQSGLFVWYSSKSSGNRRGSVLVYS